MLIRRTVTNSEVKLDLTVYNNAVWPQISSHDQNLIINDNDIFEVTIYHYEGTNL